MGFRALRVINEDVFGPGTGFGMHGHRDMEILTYVLSGACGTPTASATVGRPAGRGAADDGRHGDPPQRVQRVGRRAGAPVSDLAVARRPGLAPGYEQKTIDPALARDGWTLIASRDGRNGSVTVRQDVDLAVARLEPGARGAGRLPPAATPGFRSPAAP